MLEENRICARVYRGDYSANWLLSEFDEDVWVVRNRGREEAVNGKWIGAVKINWNIGLGNGYRLTDRRYIKLLRGLKSASFILKAGLAGPTYTSYKWQLS